MALEVPTEEVALAGQCTYVRTLEVRVDPTPVVRVALTSSRRIDKNHVDALERLINGRLRQEGLVRRN